jgi:predicted transcriptional regulator
VEWSRAVVESSSLQMGKRERQIIEALYRLGEASVAQVRSELSDPPSYSAAVVRQAGKRYLYRPATPKHKVRRSALRNLVRTFFGSAPVDAVAALLDGSAGKLSVDDLNRIRAMIRRAEDEQASTGVRITNDTSGSSTRGGDS